MAKSLEYPRFFFFLPGLLPSKMRVEFSSVERLRRLVVEFDILEAYGASVVSPLLGLSYCLSLLLEDGTGGGRKLSD